MENLGSCAREFVFRQFDIRDRPVLDEALHGL